MKKEWIHECRRLAIKPGEHYVSNTRKIFRGVEMNLGRIDDDLTLHDIGYHTQKLRALERLYTDPTSVAMAAKLQSFYRESGRAVKNNDSVAFSTMAHFIKNKMERRRGVSAQGPCLLSVAITDMLPRPQVTLFYRTSDLLRKFPADLIFVRGLINDHFDSMGGFDLTAYFANLTVASPYYPVLFQWLDDIPAELEKIRKQDEWFWKCVVTFSAQYFCPEHKRGIDKYSQTKVLKKFALTTITDKAKKRDLQAYLRRVHPGYKRAYSG